MHSDDEDSVFYRGFQSASFSARVKRTRDHFLAHFLHGVESVGGAADTSGDNSAGESLENRRGDAKGEAKQ